MLQEPAVGQLSAGTLFTEVEGPSNPGLRRRGLF